MRSLMLCMLVACVDDNTSTCPTIESVCGARPLAPGWAASFDAANNTATMSIADFNAIASWRDAVTTWGDCAWKVGR